MKTLLLSLRHRGFSIQRDQRGAAQVEFALSIFTILFVVFMLFELCSCIYTYVVMSEAANEGVRYASVRDGIDTNLATDTANQVKAYATNSMHDITGMDVTVTLPSDEAPTQLVTVEVSYPYIPFTQFMTDPPTMHAYAQGKLIY